MTQGLVDRTAGKCPVCRENVWFAAGRGLCSECMLTFPQPKLSRSELVAKFMPRYFMSKRSGFYHREGCKYLGNIDPNNLVITSEPWGIACKCVR